MISCDDHVVEPPHTFEGRVPAALADRAPRVVEVDDGREAWLYDGQLLPERRVQRGRRPPGRRVQLRPHPLRRDAPRRVGHRRAHPRHGPQRRLRVAQLPVVPPGLRRAAAPAGRPTDAELALACVRAWNDWHLEEWAGHAPERIIPLQLPYLLDPEVGADGGAPQRRARLQGGDLLRGAAPARPAVAALRLLGPDHARPARRPGRSCACTSARRARRPPRHPTRRATPSACSSSATRCSPRSTGCTRRSRCASPNLKICLSEGGIGWVAGLIDRLEHVRMYDAMYGTWNDVPERPADVFRRNFWFCAIDDPSAYRQLDVHRRRQRDGRVRLPPRRLHLAEHAADAPRAPRRPPRRRRRAHHLGATPPSSSATTSPRPSSATPTPTEPVVRRAAPVGRSTHEHG